MLSPLAGSGPSPGHTDVHKSAHAVGAPPNSRRSVSHAHKSFIPKYPKSTFRPRASEPTARVPALRINKSPTFQLSTALGKDVSSLILPTSSFAALKTLQLGASSPAPSSTRKLSAVVLNGRRSSLLLTTPSFLTLGKAAQPATRLPTPRKRPSRAVEQRHQHASRSSFGTLRDSSSLHALMRALKRTVPDLDVDISLLDGALPTFNSVSTVASIKAVTSIKELAVPTWDLSTVVESAEQDKFVRLQNIPSDGLPQDMLTMLGELAAIADRVTSLPVPKSPTIPLQDLQAALTSFDIDMLGTSLQFTPQAFILDSEYSRPSEPVVVSLQTERPTVSKVIASVSSQATIRAPTQAIQAHATILRSPRKSSLPVRVSLSTQQGNPGCTNIVHPKLAQTLGVDDGPNIAQPETLTRTTRLWHRDSDANTRPRAKRLSEPAPDFTKTPPNGARKISAPSVLRTLFRARPRRSAPAALGPPIEYRAESRSTQSAAKPGKRSRGDVSGVSLKSKKDFFSFM